MRRLLAGLLCLAAALSGAGVVAVSPAAGAQGVPADDPDLGLIYSGLQRGAPGSLCQGAYEIPSRAQSPAAPQPLRCTHGPDPVPADLDPRPGQDPQFRAGATPPGGSALAAADAGTVPCYGNGTDGYRVQLVYARESGTPDAYAEFEASFRSWGARVDDVFNASAAKTGGIRHIRYVTDSQCRPVIERMIVSAAGVDDFQTQLNELDAAGVNRVDRKYLIWVDTPKRKYCGIAILYDDGSGDATPGRNVHNGNPSYPGLVGRVDRRCWGQANPVEAHELIHTLGGVQSAPGHTSDAPPNATNNNHCFDESDRLCYADGGGGAVVKADGTPTSIQYRCPASHEALLDCNNDDYFSTNPPPGNWLARYWNTASSAWLATAPPAGTPATSVGGNAWYTNGTKAGSGPSGSTIRVYGTNAAAGVPYQLVTGRNGVNPSQPCGLDLVPVNPTTVFAGSGGVIGAVTGTVDRLPGAYQVCFAQVDPVSGPRVVTGVSTFTVT